jgi:ABC-2 type transport system permease protein
MIVLDIAGCELRRLFQSPLAWLVLAVLQFLLALFFFLLLSRWLEPGPWQGTRGLTESVVAGMLQIAGVLLLLVSPLLTMRLFSEERQRGTIQLLLSSPIGLGELVLGKYLGLLAFVVCLLAMISLMPLALLFGSSIDLGQFAAGLLGLFLLAAAFIAAGLFISTLTAQPVVAATGTFAMLFVLWIMHVAGESSGERTAALLSWLSVLRHYENLVDGLFTSVDIVYYLLFIGVFLILSVWRLDALRTWR